MEGLPFAIRMRCTWGGFSRKLEEQRLRDGADKQVLYVEILTLVRGKRINFSMEKIRQK